MADVENDDMFIEPLPDYLRCPVCLCCLTNPYQTPCGHRFCKDCILPIMHSRTALCPVDRTPVNATNTFPDNAARLQINALKIRCLNEGCDWKGEYSDKGDHKCAYAPIPCDFCNNLICKADLDTHKTACPQRKAVCEHCGLEVVYSKLPHHHDQCSHYPLPCQYSCSSGPIPRKDLEGHYQGCPAFRIPCTMAPFGCTLLVKRSDLPEHVLTCGPKHAHKMATALLELQKQVDELSVRVGAQEESTQTLETTLYPCSGQFTWRIDNIRSKILAAEAGEPGASVIYSPSFYSFESGYKMCLCVYPAGDNTEGFLSLYLVLMRGQFDEVLPWPFQKRVVLSLLNCRVPNQPLLKDIHPDPRLHYFSRPESPRNVGYGYPKYIALPKLTNEDSDLVENGAIFIRAIVFHNI